VRSLLVRPIVGRPSGGRQGHCWPPTTENWAFRTDGAGELPICRLPPPEIWCGDDGAEVVNVGRHRVVRPEALRSAGTYLEDLLSVGGQRRVDTDREVEHLLVARKLA
jgi:hypothetical protein